MRSIKPGRGPSLIGGIGAIVVGVAGVGWTIGANQIGAPGFFSIFGVGFVIVAVCIAVYNFKNATGKNRYSSFDITGGDEEPDPLNQRFGESAPGQPATASRFCSQCGEKLPEGARFCPGCGQNIEENKR